MPQLKTRAEKMAVWVKALVAKPEGQLYSISQIRRVEGLTVTSCPLTLRSAGTDTMVIHVTIRKKSSAGTFMEWKIIPARS